MDDTQVTDPQQQPDQQDIPETPEGAPPLEPATFDGWSEEVGAVVGPTIKPEEFDLSDGVNTETEAAAAITGDLAVDSLVIDPEPEESLFQFPSMGVLYSPITPEEKKEEVSKTEQDVVSESNENITFAENAQATSRLESVPVVTKENISSTRRPVDTNNQREAETEPRELMTESESASSSEKLSGEASRLVEVVDRLQSVVGEMPEQLTNRGSVSQSSESGQALQTEQNQDVESVKEALTKRIKNLPKATLSLQENEQLAGSDASKNPWSSIISSQLSELAEAKQKGETDRVNGIVREVLVTLDLASSDGREIVKKDVVYELAKIGVAGEVIEVSRQIKNFVTVEPPTPEGFDPEWGATPEETPRMGDICSVTSSLGTVLPPLEYAVGVGEKTSVPAKESENATTAFSVKDSMIAIEAVSASSMDHKDKEKKIDALTHHVVSILLSPTQEEDWQTSLGQTETLIRLAELNPRFLREGFDGDFETLRDMRMVGSNSRNNDTANTFGADALAAYALVLGRRDIAEKIITASQAEIDQTNGEPNIFMEIRNAAEEIGTEASDALDSLRQIVSQKQENVDKLLTAAVQDIGLTPDKVSSLEHIVKNSRDPELLAEAISQSASLITAIEKEDPRLRAKIQVLLYGYKASGLREQGLLFTVRDGGSAVPAKSLVSLLSSDRVQRHLGSVNSQDFTTRYDIGDASIYLRILDSPLFDGMDTASLLGIIPQEGWGQFAESLSSINATPELLTIFADDGLDSSIKKILIAQLCSAEAPNELAQALVSMVSSSNVLKLMNENYPLHSSAECITRILLNDPDVKKRAEQIEKVVATTGLFTLLESDIFSKDLLERVVWKVLSVENPSEKAHELETAFIASGLLSESVQDGLATTYINSLVVLMINNDTPTEAAVRIESYMNELDTSLNIPKDRVAEITGYITQRIFDMRGRGKDPDILQRTQTVIDIAKNTELLQIFESGNSFGALFGQKIWSAIFEVAREDATEQARLISESFSRLNSAIEGDPSRIGAAQTILYALHGDLVKNIDIVTSIATETTLLELLQPESGYSSLSEKIISRIRDSKDPLRDAITIGDQLSSDSSLWFSLYQLSKITSGEVSEVGHQDGLSVHNIPVALPLPNFSDEQNKEVLRLTPTIPVSEMSVEEKRSIADLSQMTDEQIESLTSIPFDLLNEGYQETVLAFRIFEAVTLSRSDQAKVAATQRNAETVETGQPFLQAGDLVHSTRSPQILREILTDGALCGELIGMDSSSDHYPFNLDTVAVGEEVASMRHQDAIETLDATSYGAIGIVFGRGNGSLHQGEEFPATGSIKNHTLVLGGLPATEIKAIVLRTPTVTDGDLKQIKDAVIESDIYIPVIRHDGTVELTFEQWEAERSDRNFGVARPLIVDSAIRIPNSKRGSNEGAMFLMPPGGVKGRAADGPRKPPVRYYVKFGEIKPVHIASELLADSLYRAVVPELVPSTFPVIVEGRFARASEWREGEGEVTQAARNEGFIMDCLLANWDAPFNPENIIMSAGHGLRIDTGGALEFRAQGERKGEEGVPEFGEEVKEIEVGTDRQKLGDGMRQEYVGLTDEEIKNQVKNMHERLTDGVIDRLVDSQRLPSVDRTRLKRVLKARRDFIIKRFSPELLTQQESQHDTMSIAA